MIEGLDAPILEEIPFPGHANRGSWRDYAGRPGYQEVVKIHPAKNRPEPIRWLIEKYWPGEGLVYDPMAGIGTVMWEADAVAGRRIGFGADVNPRWRSVWPEGADQTGLDVRDVIRVESTKFVSESVTLVVTSPSFFRTNHKPGDTEAQRQYSAQANSAAGGAFDDDIPGDLGNAKTLSEYCAGVSQIYRGCHELLVPGGRMVVVVRNRIWKGQETKFVQSTMMLLIAAGFVIEGMHPRKIRPSFRVEQRRKLCPDQPWVKEEFSIVARKV